MRRALLPIALALAGAAPAHALTQRQVVRELRSAMSQAGGSSGAFVTDLTTGERLYSIRADANRLPASNEKLFTSVAALSRFGEDGTLRTTALATQPLSINGTLDGNLYLRGEGDPALTQDRLEALAQDLADAGLSRVTGHVIGDDSAFDQRRGVPSAGYQISSDVAPLGALMLNRGFQPGGYQKNPPRYAAGQFARELRDAGVRLTVKARAGATPPGALALATRRSPTIAALLLAMNVPSDNYIAEMLLKAVGMTDDQPGTTRRGARFAEGVAEEQLDVTPHLVDGSGLSRNDHTTPREVVTLLAGMLHVDAFYGSLAIMGRTGTLANRLTHSTARGRCRGKTGTLSDVSALSGYCRTTGGDTLAFSILMNRVNPYGARPLQDRMVSAIARFSG